MLLKGYLKVDLLNALGQTTNPYAYLPNYAITKEQFAGWFKTQKNIETAFLSYMSDMVKQHSLATYGRYLYRAGKSLYATAWNQEQKLLTESKDAKDCKLNDKAAIASMFADSKQIFEEYRDLVLAKLPYPFILLPKEDRHLFYLKEIVDFSLHRTTAVSLSEYFREWHAWQLKYQTQTPQQVATRQAAEFYLNAEARYLKACRLLGTQPCYSSPKESELSPYELKGISKWKIEDVVVFLTKLGIPQEYIQCFKNFNIDGNELLTISEEDLIEFEIQSTFIRKKILQAVKNYKPQSVGLENRLVVEENNIQKLLEDAIDSYDEYKQQRQIPKCKPVVIDHSEEALAHARVLYQGYLARQ